jgi:hypothetical protein
MNNEDDVKETACFDIPATRGPAVLALLVELDPLAHPDSEKRYQERAERFCQNLMWRRLTGEVTPGFINAAVERMFTAAEIIDEVQAEVLQTLKFKLCQLYFK